MDAMVLEKSDFERVDLGAQLVKVREGYHRPRVAVARKRPTLPRASPFPPCGGPVCYIGMLVGL